jgi:hypothetical protein
MTNLPQFMAALQQATATSAPRRSCTTAEQFPVLQRVTLQLTSHTTPLGFGPPPYSSVGTRFSPPTVEANLPRTAPLSLSWLPRWMQGYGGGTTRSCRCAAGSVLERAASGDIAQVVESCWRVVRSAKIARLAEKLRGMRLGRSTGRAPDVLGPQASVLPRRAVETRLGPRGEGGQPAQSVESLGQIELSWPSALSFILFSFPFSYLYFPFFIWVQISNSNSLVNSPQI